jgi:hypothetical protein
VDGVENGDAEDGVAGGRAGVDCREVAGTNGCTPGAGNAGALGVGGGPLGLNGGAIGGGVNSGSPDVGEGGVAVAEAAGPGLAEACRGALD